MGFSVVEGLLVLIIVLLIGFIGYYVWHAQKDTSKTLSASNAASTPTPAKPTANPAVHTSQQAVSLVQSTMNTFMATMKTTAAEATTSNVTNPPQAGLDAIRDHLTSDTYTKANAILNPPDGTSQRPTGEFACTTVSDYFTTYLASLAYTTSTTATVTVALSGQSVPSATMTTTVDLASLKISGYTCN